MSLDLDKFRKVCGLLSSSSDGERAAAALQATAMLAKAGLSWSDIAVLPPAPAVSRDPSTPPPRPAEPFRPNWAGQAFAEFVDRNMDARKKAAADAARRRFDYEQMLRDRAALKGG